MNKGDLQKSIAETAYNVGFGAKKHFATFDIVDKSPGAISFFAMAFGIYSLAFDGLSTKFISASFTVVGIIGLYISFYGSKKDDYEKSGIILTQLFNELNRLYHNVKDSKVDNLDSFEENLRDIESRYYPQCISKQIMFSDWYAHYKFFWQHQIDWIDEQKNFKFFRDKMPLSFTLSVTTLVLGVTLYGCVSLPKLCALVSL